MALDHELPLWSIRPNWSESITERLSWLSDVLVSLTGHEQRIALRLSPRRSLEATFNPFENERTFLELAVQRLGRREWMVPLWFYNGKLTASGTGGDTSLAFDTTYMEFSDGGMAILVGPDAFSCEAVQIDTVSTGGMTLVEPLVGDWPVGSKLHPLRRAWIESDDLIAITSKLGQTRIRFDIDKGNTLDGGDETFSLYQGLPLVTQFPNWSESPATKFEWLSEQFDGNTGLRYVNDAADRAFQARRHRLLLHGRQEHMELRQLLYRLQGRVKPFWIPSYNQDAVTARASASASQIVDIQRVGLGYIGTITEDIAHMLIGGNEPVNISSMGGPMASNEERLVLEEPLSRDIAVGEKLSFLHQCRLDGDTVTIEHISDADGAANVNISFRDFMPGRDGSAAGDFPIPVSTMQPGGCGDDEITLPSDALPFPLIVETNLPNPMPVNAVFGKRAAELTCNVTLYHVGSSGEVSTIDCQFSIDVSGIYGIFPSIFPVSGPLSGGYAAAGYYSPGGGTTAVLFDFNIDFEIGDYNFTANFYRTGSKMGMSITNDDDNPVYIASSIPYNSPTLKAYPYPDRDYSLPIWGSPAQNIDGAFGNVKLIMEANRNSNGWTQSFASSFDYSIVAKAGPTEITLGKPYQKNIFANSTYQPMYNNIYFYLLGATNPSEFTPCITASQWGSTPGGPCS